MLRLWRKDDREDDDEPVTQPTRQGTAAPPARQQRPPAPAQAPVSYAVPEGVVARKSELPPQFVVLTRAAGGELPLPREMMSEVAIIAFPVLGPNATVWRLTVQGWINRDSKNHQASASMTSGVMGLGVQRKPKDVAATQSLICALNGVERVNTSQTEDARREQVATRAAQAETDANTQNKFYKAFYQILLKAVTVSTADIHIEVRYGKDLATGRNASRIRFRVDGDMDDRSDFENEELKNPVFLRGMIAFMFNNFCVNKSESQWAPDLFLSAQLKDLRIEGVLIRGRFQTFDMSGEELDGAKPFDMVLRILYAERQDIPTLTQLGFLPWQITQLERFINGKSKLCCLSGKVGSGKSTTLRSLFAMLPLTWKKYAVEDPVEYFHPNCSQVSAKDKKAMDLVLKSLKRGDLNALLMGETRNSDTLSLIRNITFSGHQAFTTTHSESALGQLPYFQTPDMGSSSYELANPSFIGMLFHQVLVRKLCPECALVGKEARGILGEKRVSSIEDKYGVSTHGFRARNPDGCPVCRAKSQGMSSRFGYQGQDVLAEMFVPTLDDLELIEKRASIELTRNWRQSHAAFDSDDCTGKTVQEVGLYKALIGKVDIRSVEDRSKPFADADVFPNRPPEAFHLPGAVPTQTPTVVTPANLEKAAA